MKNDQEKLLAFYQAIEDVILRDVEKSIKALYCDTTAISEEHLIGYKSGFNAAKRAVLEILFN